MTEREVDYKLWVAFYLGVRVMAAHEGKDDPGCAIGSFARMLREIAESEATLEDPTALAARFPDAAESFQRLSTLVIRADRDLSKRIFAGFMIATDVVD